MLDVVGVNTMRGQLVIGECKWGNAPVDESVLRELVEKSARQVIPAGREWQVYFLAFARSGFNAAALAYADEINRSLPAGSNWKCVGMRLLDLDQVDRDLIAWSR